MLLSTALLAASQGPAPALCSCLFPCLLTMRVPEAKAQQYGGVTVNFPSYYNCFP